MGLGFSFPGDRSEFLDRIQVHQRFQEVKRILTRHSSFLYKQVTTNHDFKKRFDEVMKRIGEMEEIPVGDGYAALANKRVKELCELFEHQVGGVRPDCQYVLYPAAGAIAIALSKTLTAPLARLTILSQVAGMHYRSRALMRGSITWEAVRVVSDEGFKALWKGNAISVIRRLLFASLSMGLYVIYRNFLGSIIGSDDASSTRMVNLMAGGLAGMYTTVYLYPLDVVRTRIAAQRNSMYGLRGTWHAFCDLRSELYSPAVGKGLRLALLGTVPSMAISFFVYESFKSFLKARRPDVDSPITVGLACGSVASLAASTATYPIDLVRRRMQLEGIGGRAPIYRGGVRKAFRTIVRREGFRGLYRGIVPQCLRVIPGHAVAFTSFEMMKTYIAYRDLKRIKSK